MEAEVHLVDVILDAYELGKEVGSREALRSLDDIQILLGGGYDEPVNNPDTATSTAPELDPDVVFLDNIGERVLVLERVADMVYEENLGERVSALEEAAANRCGCGLLA